MSLKEEFENLLEKLKVQRDEIKYVRNMRIPTNQDNSTVRNEDIVKRQHIFK